MGTPKRAITYNPDSSMTYKQERRAERNARILELHRRGLRHDAIADFVFVSPARVCQILTQQGIYSRGKYQRSAA